MLREFLKVRGFWGRIREGFSYGAAEKILSNGGEPSFDPSIAPSLENVFEAIKYPVFGTFPGFEVGAI